MARTRLKMLLIAGFMPLLPAVNGLAASDEHAHHHEMMAAPSVQISKHAYQMPGTPLTDEKGVSVNLRDLMANRPVVVNFIYTSCTTICPVMTASLLQLQRQLAGSRNMPLFVSISVDPDFDSPAILKSYAARFGADWTFLTGSRADVLSVLGGFDAWRGSKANHAAVTLMRGANAAEWTRVEGLASAQQLASIWSDVAS
jgi:protein SCO1